MHEGELAVSFPSWRGRDERGYQPAAEAMATLAARPPGGRGSESARGADGFGGTVNYRAMEAAAIAWRDQADGRAARDGGRACWSRRYAVAGARVVRGHGWTAA